jgi:hypothetical protein
MCTHALPEAGYACPESVQLSCVEAKTGIGNTKAQIVTATGIISGARRRSGKKLNMKGTPESQSHWRFFVNREMSPVFNQRQSNCAYFQLSFYE